MLSNPSEQLVEAFWIRGLLRYKLKPHQIEIYESVWNVLLGDHQTYVVNCSRRYGKSFCLILIAIEFAIRYPNSQIKYAIPVGKEYLDMILPSVNTIVQDLPEHLIRSKHLVHMATNKRLIFANGSVIKFAGTNDDKGTGLRGNTSHLNIVDEAGFMDELEAVYKTILFPQVLTTNGKTIFVSTPPVTQDHYYAQLYRQHEELKQVSQFTIWDNTSLTPEQIQTAIQECGGQDSTEFQREFECKFVVEQNRVIIPQWTDIHCIDVEPDEYYQYYHKYVALDPGVKDLTAGLFAYYDYQNAVLIIEDEITMNGPTMTTDKLAEVIRAKETQLWNTMHVHKRIADNELLLVQDLTSKGVPFGSTTKSTVEQMTNKVKIWVQTGKIVVNPRCSMLLGCLRYGIWRKGQIGHEFDRSKTYGHYDHLAALVYLVRGIDTTTNPIPTTYGMDLANMHVPREILKQTTKDATTLAKALLPRRYNK